MVSPGLHILYQRCHYSTLYFTIWLLDQSIPWPLGPYQDICLRKGIYSCFILSCGYPDRIRRSTGESWPTWTFDNRLGWNCRIHSKWGVSLRNIVSHWCWWEHSHPCVRSLLRTSCQLRNFQKIEAYFRYSHYIWEHYLRNDRNPVPLDVLAVI